MKVTAASLAMPPASEAVAPAGGDVVCWRGDPLAFRLESTDPDVRGRARIVFRPWMDAGATASPARSWRAERGTGAGWLVREAAGKAVGIYGSSEAVVRAVEYRGVQTLVECSTATTLHAALVARGADGVAILGAGESGKSTLACALWQRGWSLLGDDSVVVEPEGGRAWSVPRRVSLRHPSRRLLGDIFWDRMRGTPACDVLEEGCLFHPDEVDGRSRPGYVHLAALVFLGRRGAGRLTARPTPLPAAQALLALLPYSNVIRQADAGATIRRFQPLVTSVPAWDLGRGPLGDMAAALEGLLVGPGQ